MTDAKLQRAREAHAKAQRELDALEAAESAKAAKLAAERDGRAREYALRVKANWLADVEANREEEKAARARLLDLLAAEPWFSAFVEYKSHALKTRKIVDTAQNSKAALGEIADFHFSISYAGSVVEILDRLADERARDIADDFAADLAARREAYVNGDEA
ncbi:hypothetical protein [Streptomyces sp. NPDC002692]